MDLTLFFAQLFGLAFLVIGLSLLVERKVLMDTINEFVTHRPLLYLLGILSLVGGLAMVLNYNYWNEGFTALVITIIGWLFVLRGVFGLFASQSLIRGVLNLVDFRRNYYLYAWIVLVVGIYLTYAGLFPASGMF